MLPLNQSSTITGSDGSGYVLQLIWVFVVLIVILFLIIYTIKFLSNRNKLWRSNQGIDLLTGIGVGTNRSVQVVEVGGKLYIVGVGENVTLLDKIEDPEQVSTLKQQLEMRQTFGSDPIGAALRALRERKQSKSVQDEELSAASFQDVFNEKIRRMSGRHKQVEHLLQKQEGTAEDDER